ncbi:acetoacetate--CoA ligase [Sphingomonas sp. HITSZ_GF]|uniref:acetoacetate--CoA ligase n=1 Tax=Sphingomonas sp. HITSZ_GF TaxID=3037247 RepID=UPI00240D1619|nr:acetoacetate--CoA ligase [Sphingomonas sp. HITSZ_GF]MDG2535169.1 acetoacetate--CoA ligase [Sphingomonas sp. HITSZ_GF]
MTTLIAQFRQALAAAGHPEFADFEALHRWSVEQPEAFWRALWEFDAIESPDTPGRVLASDAMPGAIWFPGVRVNYARQALRHAAAGQASGHPAIIAEDERGAVETVEWRELARRVAAFSVSLRRLGIGRGDRVVAYLPNRPEAAVAFLACAAIGAIWAICAPDMGVPAILERFRQIEPKLLIATDGVHYAGRDLDRSDVVAQLRAELPSVEALVLVRSGLATGDIGDALDFAAMQAIDGEEVENFEPEWLPFDHPLWIVYSSGTTGKPKALVHGHGGILLGGAAGRIHSDLGASYDPRTPGERFHWFSSTGWMMWNTQIGGLLAGATICIFDGSPAGSRDAPDWGTLWRFVARNRVTFFGSGAQFYSMCAKMGLDLAAQGDLSALRALGSTASPLPAAVQTGISAALAGAGVPGIWWFNSSGGTDICGAFCTGNRELPEVPGKLQCRQLGAAVEAWDESGRAVTDEVGELVCTRPLPNMPLFLWGDADGSRYRDSYFDTYPGVWRHGDWLKIEPDGTCEIFGRSDATINRGGHRMGTSEIYAAIEQLDQVADSLVVDVRVAEGDSQLLLFVVPGGGARASDIADLLRGTIRSALSPRFVPDRIVEVAAVPRTLSSKKQELPIKRLFEGVALAKVIDPAAMANPECLDEYVALARVFKAAAAPA